MNLYIISQEHNTGYDTFDSAIVCAETEEDAKVICPYGYDQGDTDYDYWAAPEYVTVTYLGIADSTVKPGIVLASFNAG
jgi:hypothetical protein